MRKKLRNIKVTICRICIFIMIFISCLAVAQPLCVKGEQHGKHILFISPYSYEWPIVPEQLQQIMSVMNSNGIDVNVLFMDTKNVSYEVSEGNLVRKIEEYYNNGTKYDAVLVGDDAALKFALEYRDEYFHNIPIVFEGVNSLELVERALDYEGVTGIYEKIQIRDTIEFATTIQKNATKVVFIADNSLTGIGTKNQFIQEVRDSDLESSILNTSDSTLEALIDQLSSYKNDTILIYGVLSDVGGKNYSLSHAVKLVCNNANIPVYSADGVAMGMGILGGYGISYKQMGIEAAEEVVSILSGEQVSSFDIVQGNPVPMIDYEVMNKFGISKSGMPDNTVYINKTEKLAIIDLIKENETIFICVFVTLIILIMSLFIYLYHQEKKQQKQMQLLNDQQRIILEHTALTTWVFDMKERTITLNDKYAEEVGQSNVIDDVPESIIRASRLDKISTKNMCEMYDKLYAGEPVVQGTFYVNSGHNNQFAWGRITYITQYDSDKKPTKAIGFLVDVSAEVEREQRLKYGAERDSLTGLYNRKVFRRLVENAMQDEINIKRGIAVAIMDVDRFKEVNDTFGHQLGDYVLKEIAAMLKLTLSTDEIVGRLGGDEFVFILMDIKRRNDIEQKVNKIINGIHRIELPNGSLVKCSIGITQYCPDKGDNFDGLYNQFDQALYEAKRNGRDGFWVYGDK